jgi:hypothetical protein
MYKILALSDKYHCISYRENPTKQYPRLAYNRHLTMSIDLGR